LVWFLFRRTGGSDGCDDGECLGDNISSTCVIIADSGRYDATSVAVGADHGFDGDLCDSEEEVLDGDVRFHGKGKRFRSSENSCTGGGTFVGVARKNRGGDDSPDQAFQFIIPLS
jgi:hypothetical protein